MPSYFSICIGRQLASGGRAIGKLLAQRLDCAYYDKEIIFAAARESGFSPEVFERSDERPGFFATAIRSLSPFAQAADLASGPLSDDALFNFQCEGIRHAAARGNCIFIGRLANYVLRDNPRMLSVFVTADKDERARRIAQTENIDTEAALRLIEKADSRRADFYNFYSGLSWGAADGYDLCINSSRLGIEETASFIEAFARQQLKIE